MTWLTLVLASLCATVGLVVNQVGRSKIFVLCCSTSSKLSSDLRLQIEYSSVQLIINTELKGPLCTMENRNQQPPRWMDSRPAENINALGRLANKGGRNVLLYLTPLYFTRARGLQYRPLPSAVKLPRRCKLPSRRVAMHLWHCASTLAYLQRLTIYHPQWAGSGHSSDAASVHAMSTCPSPQPGMVPTAINVTLLPLF